MLILFLLTLKIIIYWEIFTLGNGKYSADGLNTRDNVFEGEMNRPSNNLTTQFEGIGIIHYASYGSAVSF